MNQPVENTDRRTGENETPGDKLPPSPYGPFFSAWWFSFCVLALMLILNGIPEDWPDQLDLRGYAIDNGEWWRIITSQFIHLSFNHTFLNITGFFIITASFRNEVRPLREAITLLICCLGTGVSIWQFHPELQPYVGMSGAIYGLLACYIILGYRSTPFLSVFFLVFLIGKFTYEHLIAPADTTTAEFIGGMVAAESHLYGAATGLILGLFWYARDSKALRHSSASQS